MECVTVAQSAKYREVIVTCGNGQTVTAPSDFRHHADITPEIHDISPTEGTIITCVQDAQLHTGVRYSYNSILKIFSIQHEN